MLFKNYQETAQTNGCLGLGKTSFFWQTAAEKVKSNFNFKERKKEKIVKKFSPYKYKYKSIFPSQEYFLQDIYII